MYKEFRLSGSGGQGVILMGIILAEAGAAKGLEVLQSQSYGPEARGGASKCDVILSEETIDFPVVREPDLFISITQDSADKHGHGLKESSVAIFDSGIDIPDHLGTENIFVYPIIETARMKLGKPITANIITLGVISALTDIFSQEELLKAILSRVPKESEGLNKRAFHEGIKLVNRDA